MLIKCSEILADPNFNCRGKIAPTEVVELARNIQKNGQLSPVWVRKIVHSDYKYSLVAGFRRYTAVYVVNKEEYIDAILKVVNEGQARVLNLIENLQRKDLNIVQEANAIKNLVAAGYSKSFISKEIEKSQPWVEVRMALLTLPEQIQQQAAAGVLTQEHVKKIAAVRNPEKQFEMVRGIIDRKARGEKAIKLKEKRNIHSKKVRSRHDIGFMRDHVYDNIGPCLATRVCAWAAGEISDYDCFQAIKEEANKQGKQYILPKEIREEEVEEDDYIDKEAVLAGEHKSEGM